MTVAVRNRAYYLFVEGEKIMGVIPVACGDSKYFLAPKVSIEELGARIVFFNVNGRAIATDFLALIMFENGCQESDLPSVEEIYKKLFDGNGVFKLKEAAATATNGDGPPKKLNMF